MKKIYRCHWQYVLFSIKGAWKHASHGRGQIQCRLHKSQLLQPCEQRGQCATVSK